MAWRGIAIGLIISAPMGPVGMLCIQRTLDKGRRAGLFTGIGAAISDLLYSLLTGFGLSFIEEFLERNQNIIQLVGSAVLIAFGVYLFRKNPSKGLKKPVDETVSVKKSILGGFLFTVSNPLILFLTIGLFARFNFLLPEFHLWQYLTGFVFIFVGALAWWWFITFSVDKVRSHFNIRSMWLINKIIGVIILLFAVVGIFTATSALVQGQKITCWNASRGFGPFSGEPGSNRIENRTSDTLYLLTPCGDAQFAEFRFRMRNHTTGKGWGMVVEGSPKSAPHEAVRLHADIRSMESDFDGISTEPVLEIEIRSEGGLTPLKKSFADRTGLIRKITSGMTGPDPTGSLNFFKVLCDDDMLTLYGGLHSPERLGAVNLPDGFTVDSIGFYIAPGGAITPSDIRLTLDASSLPPSPWEDPDILDGYLQSSLDWMEGYWQILDRSLDEALLRLGGDYRLALVRELDGYDLIYIQGAKVNAGKWSRGMVKARLRPSGITGIWNVEWIDSMHKPMAHDLKAQADRNGTLTIQFPYQDSQLRLHHLSTPEEENGR